MGVLLDWIPVTNRLSAIHLGCSSFVSRNRLERRWPFVVSVYALTHCSPFEAGGEFTGACLDYFDLYLQRPMWLSLAEFGYFEVTQIYNGSGLGVGVSRTDNDDPLTRVCSDPKLFLAHTNLSWKATSTYLTLVRPHGIELRLITFPVVTGCVDQLKIIDHSDSHPWPQIIIWSELVFVWA